MAKSWRYRPSSVVSLLVKPEPWMTNAACLGCDPDMFFPARGESWIWRDAIAVCETCPVRVECLEFALDHNEKVGIWGGYTERQRRRMRRERAAS